MVLGTTENRLAWERRRRWQRELADYVPSSVGTAVAEDESRHASVGRAVFIGVTTGVLVWTITRLLDRTFGISRSAP